MLTQTYEGTDLVIPKELIEEMGIRPGEVVIIYPQVSLTARVFMSGERDRLDALLAELAGSWTEYDEAEYIQNQRQMWATWKPRNWS
jgi:hypothetical protein